MMYIGQLYNLHPQKHALILVLKQTQAQTLTIINSNKNNIHITLWPNKINLELNRH